MAPTVLCLKSLENSEFVLTTEPSTSSQLRTLIHCHFLMRYKTALPVPQFFHPRPLQWVLATPSSRRGPAQNNVLPGP